MQKMRSPMPNRKGIHEVHDVPSRKAARLRALGWEDAGDAAAPGPGSERMEPEPGPTFSLAGAWPSVRGRVRDALGMDGLPASKEEARQLLRDAGYEVED